MSYKLGYTDRFKETLSDISREDTIRILKKIEWIAQNAEQLQHEQLRNPPVGLEGICKYRVGFYRVLYWVDHAKKEITVYDVIWRRGEYRELYRR